MEKHMLPTDAQVRERIMAIGRDWEVGDIKEIPKSHDSEQYRINFMFQLMSAGRISEVCGQYAPKGTDARIVDLPINGDFHEAVLFVVKTAKRKGKLRVAALPLEPKYEPWAQEILDILRAGKGKAWVGLGWRQYLSWFWRTETALATQLLATTSEWLRASEERWLELGDKDVLMSDPRNDGGWLRPWRQAVSAFRRLSSP